jgi:hypothetical protein
MRKRLLILTWMVCFVFAGLIPAARLHAETQKLYVFGNSLIHHLTDSAETPVPHWLAYFAAQDDLNLQLDGQWGFLREFADQSPSPAWSFQNVDKAWTRQFRSFDQVGYQTILTNPANFIQYQSPDRPYDGAGAGATSPLEAALALYDRVGADKRFVVYEGWADMGPFLRSFPPNDRRLRKYHDFNQGDYHDWYVDLVARMQAARPGADIALLPVAQVLARVFLETELSDLSATVLYSDDAPHGTPTMYFLAAAVTYKGLFGRDPKIGTLPASVDARVGQHFDDVLRIATEETGALQRADAFVPATSAPEKRPSEAKFVKVEATMTEPSQVTVPALGMGLNGIADWSTQMPFVDIMKTARQWTGHVRGQWGGWGQAELEAGGYLDPDGWPTEIPTELSRIETFVLTEMPAEATHLAGVYRLTYKGQGKLNISGSARPIRYGEGEIWFRYTPGDGLVGISIDETDPDNTGDYIHDIVLLREDQIPLFDLGVTYNPEWIAQVADLRLVRFMDWMFTNGSDMAAWQDRPQLSDYSYTRRGVPVALMLDLVNQIGADPWFTMPHKADDGFVEAFAAQVKAGLRSGLKAHVEYSNELWNFNFAQTQWAIAQAEARWGRDAAPDAWFQFAGMRAAEVARIWQRVFAEEAEERLVRVVATHTDWPGLEHGLLKAPLAVTEGQPEPVTAFDAYAVTGYFGLELGTDEGAPEVLKWIENSEQQGRGYDLAVAEADKALRNGSFAHLIEEAWPYQAGVARKNGMDLIMYEGGTHVVGLGNWPADETLTAFFNHLNYTPEMAVLYQDLLAAWSAVGGTVFNAFVDVGRPSQWGSWGALRHLQDQNPRHDALVAYNAAGPTWDDARAADVFSNGRYLPGSDAADQLAGTAHADIAMGGDGDDAFTSNGGDDAFHGGAGNDHAILPGFMEDYRFFREGARLRADSRYGSVRLLSVETMAFAQAPDLIVSVSDFF